MQPSLAERKVVGFGGVGGIRTLGTALNPYNGLANRRLQPLGHHSNITKSSHQSIRKCSRLARTLITFCISGKRELSNPHLFNFAPASSYPLPVVLG